MKKHNWIWRFDGIGGFHGSFVISSKSIIVTCNKSSNNVSEIDVGISGVGCLIDEWINPVSISIKIISSSRKIDCASALNAEGSPRIYGNGEVKYSNNNRGRIGTQTQTHCNG